MKVYIEEVVMPYVRVKRRQLNLGDEHPTLALFKGQCMDEVIQLLQENNTEYTFVPANCTDRLQPEISSKYNSTFLAVRILRGCAYTPSCTQLWCRLTFEESGHLDQHNWLPLKLLWWLELSKLKNKTKRGIYSRVHMHHIILYWQRSRLVYVQFLALCPGPFLRGGRKGPGYEASTVLYFMY